MSNKDRIFVAIYLRPDDGSASTVNTATSHNSLSPSRYLWGIWIEQKGSNGQGVSYDVEDDSSEPYLMYSFDDHFHCQERSQPPANMLGRMMIGKIPQGRTSKEVYQILKRIPLPSDPATQISDTAGWTKAAIEELQGHMIAEKFDTNRFFQDAMKQAVNWQREGLTRQKANYTWGRTFP